MMEKIKHMQSYFTLHMQSAKGPESLPITPQEW